MVMMMVAPRQYASIALVVAILTIPFIPMFTWGFVIPTPCRATMVKRYSVTDTGNMPKPELDGGGRPPLEDNFYAETFFDKFALSFFRGVLQKEIDYSSSLEGYDGLIDEAQNYYVIKGALPEETQNMVIRLLTDVCGSMLPAFYRFFIAPGPWGPIATALVTPYLLKFLVGPNTVALRSDGKLGGVYVKRCRFLEATNCKGLCLNMCKLPVERFFQECLGLKMTMSPNFDTYECSLSYGLEPLPVESDPDIPVGCLRDCSCKKLEAQTLPACVK